MSRFENFEVFFNFKFLFTYTFTHSYICVFEGKVFCVGRYNASCFGIFFEHVVDKLFLEDSGGLEKDL